jgi:FkbH-like protein
MPSEPCAWPLALASLHELQFSQVTAEDRLKSHFFHTENQRQKLRDKSQSLAQWKEDLQLSVSFEPLSQATLERAAQLLNKTNQMNLSTRRLGATQLWEFSQEAGVKVWVLRVSDRFGDYGLTGLLSLREQGTVSRVEDLLLSCRVLGRGVEEKLVAFIRRKTASTELKFAFRRSPRNKVCEAFLKEHFQQNLPDFS